MLSRVFFSSGRSGPAVSGAQGAEGEQGGSRAGTQLSQTSALQNHQGDVLLNTPLRTSDPRILQVCLLLHSVSSCISPTNRWGKCRCTSLTCRKSSDATAGRQTNTRAASTPSVSIACCSTSATRRFERIPVRQLGGGASKPATQTLIYLFMCVCLAVVRFVPQETAVRTSVSPSGCMQRRR